MEFQLAANDYCNAVAVQSMDAVKFVQLLADDLAQYVTFDVSNLLHPMILYATPKQNKHVHVKFCD